MINKISHFLAVACLGALLVACSSTQQNLNNPGDQPAQSSSEQQPVRSSSEMRPSPNATVGQTVGTTDIEITYGRPSVNGREVFGSLEPYGVVWRAGANEATTITFSKDVLIEGERLASGTYGFFTIPRENGTWTVIFNDVANQWGAFEYDDREDVLRVDVTAEEAPHMEQLVYYFENIEGNEGTAVLHWSGVRVPFTIEEAGD